MAETTLFCNRLKTQITVRRVFKKPSQVGGLRGFTLVCDLAASGECQQICELNPRMESTGEAIPAHVV